MEFKWHISQMDSKIKETIDGQELQNVVNVVHWRYDATLNDYETEVYGALELNGANPNDFILYENLTKNDVIGWLEAGLDVDELQTILINKINLLINPVEATLPLPWNNEE
jgi:hypothetical protein|tara:strand:- start:971 stop:1303 length:333 start_codon:yes stop_codon:yes gene_type:complete